MCAAIWSGTDAVLLRNLHDSIPREQGFTAASLIYHHVSRSGHYVLLLYTRLGVLLHRRQKISWQTTTLSVSYEYRRLLLKLNWILPSSGLLFGVRWLETDVLGLPTGHIFKDEAWRAWPLKRGPIGSPETSISNHLTLRNNAEDGRILTKNLILRCWCAAYITRRNLVWFTR